MSKSFTKNCCCHRDAEPVRISKAEWKRHRRRGGDMGLFCIKTMQEMLKPGYVVIPLIPLLQPVAPTA